MTLPISATISWDCPAGSHIGTLIEVREGEGEIRFVYQIDALSNEYLSVRAGKDFFPSLNGNSHLRNYIESWKGKNFFTSRSAREFNLNELIGMKATLTIRRSPNPGYPVPFCDIVAIGPAPATITTSTTCPKPGAQIPNTSTATNESKPHIIINTAPSDIQTDEQTFKSLLKLLGRSYQSASRAFGHLVDLKSAVLEHKMANQWLTTKQLSELHQSSNQALVDPLVFELLFDRLFKKSDTFIFLNWKVTTLNRTDLDDDMHVKFYPIQENKTSQSETTERLNSDIANALSATILKPH